MPERTDNKLGLTIWGMPLVIWRAKRPWLALAVVCGIASFLTNFAIIGTFHRPALGAKALFIAGFLIGIIGSMLAKRRVGRRIREDGYQVCPCGYSLKGLSQTGNCPECGREFDLEVLPVLWHRWLD